MESMQGDLKATKLVFFVPASYHRQLTTFELYNIVIDFMFISTVNVLLI